MLGSDQRLIALDVDVDIGGNRRGDGVNAVGAAGAVRGSEYRRQVVLVGEGKDLVGIGGDEDLIEKRAGASGAIDPADHGLSGYFAEDLAGQAGGAESGGDDGEDAGFWGVGSV